MADEKTSRRDLLANGVRLVALVGSGYALGGLIQKNGTGGTVWQIDPELCTQCGLCDTGCVLQPSAVKAVHAYALCGYCNLCFGVYRDKRTGDETSVENARCPVDALKRTVIEPPYHEIAVDESACIGCALCVRGCNQFGNGSLYLQIRHDRCVNCNQCALAHACPPGAIKRVPESMPYKPKRPKT